MGFFTKLQRGARAATVFNGELDRLGINYRIFPRHFQSDLYTFIRETAGGDQQREELSLVIAARVVAAAMSRDCAAELGIFSRPELWEKFKAFAAWIVPLMERHGIAHRFEWPAYDAANAPDWARS